MKDPRSIMLITLVLLISIFISCFICYKRVRVEKNNNTVELAIDSSDIERLSALENITLKQVLLKLKRAGATGVALTEDLQINKDNNFLNGIDPKKENLYLTSKGLNRTKINAIKDAGLRVIPRIRNKLNLNSESLSNKVREIEGFDIVIFAEEEVLGYPNYLKGTAKALKNSNIKYGFVEFGKQLGDTALAAYAGRNIVKVHSIPIDEMENLSKQEIIDRYIRAARERSIRILYIHLLQYPDGNKDLASTNFAFIRNLNNTLVKNGFKVGKASSPDDVKLNRFEKGIIGFGVACGVVLLLSCFIGLNLYAILPIIIIIGLIPSAKILALISAIVFPSYAVISQFPRKRDKLNIGVISGSLSITMYVAAITALGGIFIAALLAGARFMLGIDSFMGVKIAFVVPILIIAGYFLFRPEEKERFNIQHIISRASSILDLNIKVIHLFLMLICAVAAAILILRSGNFGLPVPSAEKLARGTLENLLFIRPRTKEFLLGYPALIIAAIYYLRGGNAWLWFLLSVGALAPISLINSFCHIHTPLIVTVARSCIGLVLGAAIGLLIYLIWHILNKLKNRLIS